VFIGVSGQPGESESSATAARLGPVASALFGGLGTGLVLARWLCLIPDLARHDERTRPGHAGKE